MTLNEKLKWACRLLTLAGVGFCWWRSAVIEGTLAAHREVLVDIRADQIKLNRKLDRLTVGSQEPMGAAEDGPAGARPRLIPEAKETLYRVQELLEKFDGLVSDIEAGRKGVHIEGSLWKGQATAVLRDQ